jgi:hypothetical protein
MTPFDFPVLLRAPRFDVLVPDTSSFHGQLKRQRELCAVVPSEGEVKAGQVLL